MNAHFWIIVGTQVIIYILFIIATRAKHQSFMELMLSGVIGTIFGPLFDTVLSYHKIHTHYTTGNGVPFYDTGLTSAELIINGFVSYGLFLATAKILVDTLYKKEPTHFKEGLPTLFLFLTILAFGMFSISIYNKGDIHYIFAAGAILISLGEIILFFAKRQSIILETIFSRHLFLTVTTLIIACGTLYEIMNNLFPFWRFMPTSNLPHATVELIFASLGYFVLFHPCMVIWKLISRERTH